MDFLDPAKKRHHKIRLYVGYFLVAIAILTVSYLLILQSYGFDYNRKTGQIIQNGLVFVSSKPVSADVFLNGKREGSTSLKLTIPEGKYDVSIKASGYRDWGATFNLGGAGIVRLDYPLLIPQKLNTADVQGYSKTPTLATSSLDRHWLLVLQPDSLDKFDMYDLSKPTTPVTTLALPANLLKTATGPQSLKAIDWAADNQHLLLEHDYNGGPEFIIVDRLDPTKSFNINDLVGISPTSVVLRNRQFNKLYAYMGKTKTLLTVDTGTKQVTTILKDVIDYKTFGPNTVLYTSDVSKVAGQYSVNMWDGQKFYLLHNYPATTYKLDMAQYSGDTFIAVSPVSKNKVYIFKNPLPVMKLDKIPNPFIALRINNPQYVSFSPNFRFVMAQSGSSFAVYDFEEDLWHYFTLKDKVPLTSKTLWMDGYHLSLNIGGVINLYDFNSANPQKLSASLVDYNSFFNNDYSDLYTIAPSVKASQQTALTRTSMLATK